MAAPYEVLGTSTDDESIGFSLAISAPDGTSLPLDEYGFEYELVGCGASLRLDENNGITIDLTDNLVVVDPGVDYRLRAGQYRHGLRAKHLASGKVVQLFDGTWTVSEGNFR